MRKLLVIVFWLVAWQLLAMIVDNEILLVTPWQTCAAFVGLLGKVSFWKTVCVSLGRIALGFLLGLVTALLLAGVSSRSSFVEELLAPVMTLCKAVPVAVFVVLLLIWWGSSVLAVAVCFLIVLPNIYISTLEGLKNTDKRLLEMAKVFELPVRTAFFYIYRPALKPFLSSSLKLSLGMCWKSGVAAEVIGTPAFSIGEQLYMSKIQLDTAGVFAWAVVIVLLSAGFEHFILWLAERFWSWEPACQRAARECRAWTGEQSVIMEIKDRVEKRPEQTLCIEALCKKYGELQVLADVNAIYEFGQTYYLTSPSGSGKTTFLRILCGLEKGDSGRIQVADSSRMRKEAADSCRTREESVDGSRIRIEETDSADRQIAGSAGSRNMEREGKLYYSMVFQEDRLCEDYSALRNVEMVTGIGSRAEEALKRLLPDEALHKPCSQLSGGMKRRVALVRAMESDSDCVLLDEPFTGMDAETRAQAEAYIRERQNGRILIIATHI